jgi:hypothetical protein
LRVQPVETGKWSVLVFEAQTVVILEKTKLVTKELVDLVSVALPRKSAAVGSEEILQQAVNALEPTLSVAAIL